MQSVRHYNGSVRRLAIPVYLPMPHNPLVFGHITAYMYEAMSQQLDRVGYCIKGTAGNGYTLALTILSLDPIHKFVSSDVLLLNVLIKLDVQAVLFDSAGNEVSKKTFTATRLLPKSKNPAAGDSYDAYGYNLLAEQIAPKIEYYFRPFLIKAFTDDGI